MAAVLDGTAPAGLTATSLARGTALVFNRTGAQGRTLIQADSFHLISKTAERNKLLQLPERNAQKM